MPTVKLASESRIKEVSNLAAGQDGDPQKFLTGDIVYYKPGSGTASFKRRNGEDYTSAGGGNHESCWDTIAAGGPANTDSLPEGSSNLYYTDARVTLRINAAQLSALNDVQYPSAPSDGQVLKYNGSANAWQPGTDNTSSGSTPGGSSTHIQYNNAGSLAGSNKLTWNNDDSKLQIGTAHSGGTDGNIHIYEANPNIVLQRTANGGQNSTVQFHGQNGNLGAELKYSAESGGQSPFVISAYNGSLRERITLDPQYITLSPRLANEQGTQDAGSVNIKGSAELRFYNGANYIGFKAPTLAANTAKIWSLPTADGSDGQVLKTNGSGVLSWTSASGLQNVVEDTTPQLGGFLDVTNGAGQRKGFIDSSPTNAATNFEFYGHTHTDNARHPAHILMYSGDQTDSNKGYVGIFPDGNVGASDSYKIRLPSSKGAANQVLKIDSIAGNSAPYTLHMAWTGMSSGAGGTATSNLDMADYEIQNSDRVTFKSNNDLGGAIYTVNYGRKLAIDPAYNNTDRADSRVLIQAAAASVADAANRNIDKNYQGSTGTISQLSSNAKVFFIFPNDGTSMSGIQLISDNNGDDTSFSGTIRENIEFRVRESSDNIGNVAIKSSALVSNNGVTASRSPSLRFYNASDEYIGFKAPTSNTSASFTHVLPDGYGTNGQFLQTNGNGTLSWGSAASVTNLGNTPASGNLVITSSTGTDTTIPAATTSNAGVMSASDKTKLDSIDDEIIHTVTVINTGGNKYAIDGDVRNHVFLMPGHTYKFDVSDSSVSGHPFAFSTTPDNSPTSYTTGVTTSGTAGQSGAFVSIDVTYDTPDVLYYYCTNHTGMGGIAGPAEQPSGPVVTTQICPASEITFIEANNSSGFQHKMTTGVFGLTGGNTTRIPALDIHPNSNTTITMTFYYSFVLPKGAALGGDTDAISFPVFAMGLTSNYSVELDVFDTRNPSTSRCGGPITRSNVTNQGWSVVKLLTSEIQQSGGSPAASWNDGEFFYATLKISSFAQSEANNKSILVGPAIAEFTTN